MKDIGHYDGWRTVNVRLRAVRRDWSAWSVLARSITSVKKNGVLGVFSLAVSLQLRSFVYLAVSIPLRFTKLFRSLDLLQEVPICLFLFISDF